MRPGMFVSLTVRNILLIDTLDIQFGGGLCVMTGETGAGKSIILDAMGLATGARGSGSLVRVGEKNGSVTAEFELPTDHPVQAILDDHGLAGEDPEGADNLLLRRVLDSSGRGRAFINDQPVSIGLLRTIGDCLTEYHGQHDERGLLNATGHRALLDRFGGLGDQTEAVAAAFDHFRECVTAREQAEHDIKTARADEDYVRHVLAELDELDPQPGEEESLATERSLLMQSTKLADEFSAVCDSLHEGGGVDALLRGASRRLERLLERVDNGREHFADLLAVLERASIEATEAIEALDSAASAIKHDPVRLERTEERLFALRAAARKHNCTVDEITQLREKFSQRLKTIDSGDTHVASLIEAEQHAHQALTTAIQRLREARVKAAARLDSGVNRELASLKLDKARFETEIEDLPPEKWGGAGGERVEFQVSTNPGTPVGPLSRIASGGELSRFLLALKVVLAATGEAATLVFDEIDRGLGGAVAGAVGERLARLSQHTQVLVVTHSPQVAAQADHHWRIDKVAQTAQGKNAKAKDEFVVTRVRNLDLEARREEIARMLSGARITDEARAAADRLLDADAA